MTTQPPAFFYFDLGNVLLTFDHQTACEQVGHLVSLPAGRVKDLLFDSGLQTRYEQGALTSRQFYEEFCRTSGTSPQYEAFHLANSDIFQLNVPIVAIVGHLRSAGSRLGILSNTCEGHWQHVANGRFRIISHYFSVTVLSYELRQFKPDATIYRTAVARAGVEPAQVFFVDDREENVEGACRAGLDAVIYRGPHQLAADLRSRGVRFNY